MLINDYIYNEIKSYDGDEFVKDWDRDEDLEYRNDVFQDLAAKEQFGKSFSELTMDECDRLSYDILKVKEFSRDSLLCDALQDWYGSYNKMLEGIRSATVYSPDYSVYAPESVYFVTGIGYDTISDDLLGCQSDGEAKRAFLDFCNESPEVMEKGGYAYMVSKGLENSICSGLQPKEEVKKTQTSSLADRAKQATRASEVQDKGVSAPVKDVQR